MAEKEGRVRKRGYFRRCERRTHPPGALCLSSPLMSLIKASSNISALPWSAISQAAFCNTARRERRRREGGEPNDGKEPVRGTGGGEEGSYRGRRKAGGRDGQGRRIAGGDP